MEQISYQALGQVIGLALRFVMIIALIVAIIAYFKKRFALVRVIRNIFAWIFIGWGCICLFIFVGNMIFGNLFYEFIFVSVFCLAVGFLLRKLRLPVQEK